MNMEQLKEFVCLETRKRELDSELKAIAARIDDLEQSLVPQFLSDGIASMKVDGRTVYIAQDIQASPANDRAEVIVRTRPVRFGELQHAVSPRLRAGGGRGSPAALPAAGPAVYRRGSSHSASGTAVRRPQDFVRSFPA
jgi:hypothetical protein